MNNIIYQTKKIRVEKIYREEEDDKTRETKFVAYYQWYYKIPIPFTFGLFNKWVRASVPTLTEEAAMSSAAVVLFKRKYNLPVPTRPVSPRRMLLAAAKSIRENREVSISE